MKFHYLNLGVGLGLMGKVLAMDLQLFVHGNESDKS